MKNYCKMMDCIKDFMNLSFSLSSFPMNREIGDLNCVSGFLCHPQLDWGSVLRELYAEERFLPMLGGNDKKDGNDKGGGNDKTLLVILNWIGDLNRVNGFVFLVSLPDESGN